ncbi:MAG: FkbM family methyltransferase [Methanomicrobiales archaeon]|nr:FkbM family methyltransferase [Methanomicrobiales archaeon]
MEFEKLFNDSIEYTRETFAGHWVRWLIFILLSLPFALVRFVFDPQKIITGTKIHWELVPWGYLTILVIAGVLASFFISGYIVRIYRGMRPAPDFTGWTSLFADGIKLDIVMLVWFLPAIIPMLLLLLIAFGGMIGGMIWPGLFANMGSTILIFVIGLVLLIAALALLIIAALYVSMAAVRFARTESMVEGWRYSAISAIIRRIGWGNYFIALVLFFFAALFFNLVVSIPAIIPYVGWIVPLSCRPSSPFFPPGTLPSSMRPARPRHLPHPFHKENPYSLPHFSLIQPVLAAGCAILVWKRLSRIMQKRLSGDTIGSGSSMEGARPARFVNPATVPGMPVAGERTIRFVTRDLPYRQITDIREYRFDDIRAEDIVIDIGANVGAFCIQAAQYSDHVTAVEPVAWEILRENIRLNGVNVTVIEGALGDGSPSEISWDAARAHVPTFTLGQITAMAGGCDFLKCDCEGGEWLIRPEDLAGIRRIEMELHVPPIGGPPNKALLEYIGTHYDFEIERRPCHDVLGVMGILHATRRDE